MDSMIGYDKTLPIDLNGSYVYSLEIVVIRSKSDAVWKMMLFVPECLFLAVFRVPVSATFLYLMLFSFS